MVRYRTAAMSHSQIRQAVQSALEQKYPAPPPAPVDWESQPWAMDVFDGHVIHSGGPGKGMYKQEYALADDGTCELKGDPVEVETGYVQKGKATITLAASKLTAGDEAAVLLKDLKENNPLFASISDSPNAHLVVLDLTSVGIPSHHEGAIQYQLAKSGIADALPSLMTKPLHVTPGFDGHFTAGKDPIAIGTFLGAFIVKNADGSETVRAIATLWDGDFPDIVDDIKEKRAELGASYELTYLAASASRLSANVIEIQKYQFTGGAILYKTAAAHPETQLLMADKDPQQRFDVMDDGAFPRLGAYLQKRASFSQADQVSYHERSVMGDAEFALVQTVEDRIVRRFPIQDEPHRQNAWARLPQAKGLSDAERASVADKIISRAKSAGDSWAQTYTKSGGAWVQKLAATKEISMKYPGVPAEFEAVIDGIVANAVMAEQVKAKAAADDEKNEDMPAFLKKKKAELEASIKALEAEKAELNAQLEAAVADQTKLAEVTVKFEAAAAELVTKTEELEKIAAEKHLATVHAKLKAEYGLTDAQLVEKDREPLVAKMAAGKEVMSIDEFKSLIKGGKVVAASSSTGTQKLLAGGGEGADGRAVPDRELVAKNFPAAVNRQLK